jgi:sigma-E factor negative regulatory protein RseB
MKLRNNSISGHGVILHGLIYALLSVLSPAILANEDTSLQAQQLINEMSRASKELNYDGIFVYQRDGRMETMRLIHKAGAEGEQERMVSLTGQAREVIRDGKSVTCILPENRSVMVKRNQPKQFLAAQLPQPIETIADFYSFSVTGKDRVAGRSTWIVDIFPRDEYRYGYQLWIDEETKLLLKSELIDNTGRPIEQILFTQLDVVDNISPDLLKPSINGQGYTWYSGSAEDTPVRANNTGWQVTTMPRGFSQRDHEIQALAEGNIPVEHMVYSDGLAMVSVFIEKIDNEPDQIRGVSRKGGVNAYATYTDGYQVTAVGEVPQKTVQLMATSVVQNR